MIEPTSAIEQLTNHQHQLDMDSTFVGVSRQALDEVLAYVAHQPAAAQESVEVVDNILRIAGQLRRSEIAYDNARAKILAAITEWKALGDD